MAAVNSGQSLSPLGLPHVDHRTLAWVEERKRKKDKKIGRSEQKPLFMAVCPTALEIERERKALKYRWFVWWL